MRLGAWHRPRILAAALLAAGLLGAGLQGVQAQDVRIVTGTVVQLAGEQATISTNTGPMSILMSTSTRYEKEGPGTVADIQPNQFVAVTGRPTADGQEALLIRVFPFAQSTITARLNSPDTQNNPANFMTNAIVDSLVNGRLTVRLGGDSLTADTTPETQVRRPVPAVASEVTEGGRIAATGVVGGDGVLQAVVVNILGAPGGGAAAPPSAQGR